MDRNLEDVHEMLVVSEISENRKILRSIIDTIIFLRRLDLALRGHRDDSEYHSDAGEYFTGSAGNFIEF